MLVVPQELVPTYWSPVRQRPRCEPITLEDIPSVPELVRKMAQYCKNHDGVGLAAPQVGIYKSLAILLSPKSKIQVMINPRIVMLSGRDLLELEGCLSLPPSKENQHRVWRSEKVEIECGTEEDPLARVRTAHSGWVARVIQHEIDHLTPDGEVFFIDRVGPVAKGQALRKYLKFRKQLELHAAPK